MNMNEDWIEKEIQYLAQERANRKHSKYNNTYRKQILENMDYVKFFVMILCIFVGFVFQLKGEYCGEFVKYPCCMDLASESFSKDEESMSGGIWFMCSKCRVCQWQDERNQDWRGQYYCANCGAKYP